MSKGWVRLLRYARPGTTDSLTMLLLVLVGIGLEVLRPWPLKLIVDHVLSDHPLPEKAGWLFPYLGTLPRDRLLGWLALAMVFLFVATQVVSTAQAVVQTGVGTRLMYRLGGGLFDHLQRLSLSFHGSQRAGDLVRRVTTDSACLRELLLGVGLTALTAVLSLITMFAIMWQLDPSMALLALLVAPFLIVLIKLFDRPMTERTYQQQQLEGEMMALAEQTLTALPVVQAFAREEYEDRRFQGLAQQTLKAYLRALLSQTQFNIGVGAATAIGTGAMMALGGYRVLAGELTVGGLLVLLSYLASVYSPIETLAYLASTYASAKAKARRVFEVLDTEDAVAEAPAALRVSLCDMGAGAHVVMEGVSFGYETGKLVLRDVSLEALPGETVALVGATGAGKSTLVSLLPRFFDPCRGRVLFNGMDIRRIKLEELRAQVALVLQEPFLLPLTIAANIAYGQPAASRAEIVNAARAAQADEFIRRLPNGYDTVIGERGSTLSGGEKQRIAIARAILKNAPVLVLDEPTSAMDAETESLFLQALYRLLEGRTTFMIAHRLSTVRQASRIIVLDKGRIAESGTHEELIAAGGTYKQFLATKEQAPVAPRHPLGCEIS